MALQVLKDEKDAYYLNVILRIDFLVALVVAEHLLSAMTALTNNLQKVDIDLIQAVTKAKIVIQRLRSMESTFRKSNQDWKKF